MCEHPPREWVEGVLEDVLGTAPNVAEMVGGFLDRYDRSPTLAGLADGDAAAREVFKLAVLTLVDESLMVTATRVAGILAGMGAQERTHVIALQQWIARARPMPEECKALGPAFAGKIARFLTTLTPPPIPRARRGQPRATPLRLLHALEFALALVPELGIGARQRYVAAVVREWTETAMTAERVRTEGGRPPKCQFTGCANTLTLPIDVATLPVRALVQAGWFAPLRPRETCERYVPVAAHLHVQPAEVRLAVIAALEADGLLLVLPMAAAPAPPVPS
jgi:hypothetical protein